MVYLYILFHFNIYAIAKCILILRASIHLNIYTHENQLLNIATNPNEGSRL